MYSSKKGLKVIDVKKSPIFEGGQFVWKSSDLWDADDEFSRGNYETSRYVIEQVVVLDEKLFDELIHDFLEDRPYLKGKGGTGSEVDFPDVDSFWDLTEEQQEEFRDKSYRKCLLVINETINESIVVDPQGYSYARYVSVGNGNELKILKGKGVL